MRWTMALGAALGLAAAGVAEARTAPRLEGVPRFAHVFVIIEENKDYDQIVGGENAPTISHLAREYGDARRMYGEVHPSEANYVALLAGDTFGIHDDDPYYCKPGSTDPNCAGAAGPGYVDHTVHARDLGDQLVARRLSWKGYYENLPSPGSLAYIASDPKISDGTRSTALYASKHSGFVNFAQVQSDPDRAERLVGFDQLDKDLASGELPNFALIVPNQCNEMHGLSGPNVPVDCQSQNKAALIRRGDAEIAHLVEAIERTPAWKGPENFAIVITFDEGAGRTSRGVLWGDPGRDLELRGRTYPHHRGHQPRAQGARRRHALQPLLASADDRGRVRYPRAPPTRSGDGQGGGADGQAVRRLTAHRRGALIRAARQPGRTSLARLRYPREGSWTRSPR